MLSAAQGEYHVQIILFCNHTLRWQEQLSYNQLWNRVFFFTQNFLFSGQVIIYFCLVPRAEASPPSSSWTQVTAYGQIQPSLVQKSAARDMDVSHSPICTGSFFLDPKIWDVLPISMAGFCLPSPPPWHPLHQHCCTQSSCSHPSLLYNLIHLASPAGSPLSKCFSSFF